MVAMTAVPPLIAFSCGVLSVLSPCILPVIPLIAAYAARAGRWRPITLILGLSLSFTLMGVLASAFGQVFQRYQPLMYALGGGIIILFGLIMIFDVLEEKLRMVMPKTGLLTRFSTPNAGGIAGGFLFGFSLGILWTPCIGPILGAILTMVALRGEILYGGLLLFIYSLGLGVPLLALAYTSHFSVRRVANYSVLIKRVSGIILVVVGLYMVYLRGLPIILSGAV
jgi:cytochrome c-type biogenesis protein